MEKIIDLLLTENKLIYNIIAYPLGLLEMLCLFIITAFIYKLKTNKTTAVKFILISTVIGITIRLVFPMPYNFILNILCITAVLMIVLHLSLFKAIIPFCLFLLSTALAELIVFFALKQLPFTSIIHAEYMPLYKIVCCLLIYSLIILCFTILKKSKTNLNISDTINKKEKVKIIINILIAIVIVCPNLIFLIIKDMQIPTYYIIYNLICALLLFFTTTYNTHRFNKLDITTRELETANLYNNTLTKLVDMNKGFKHDISNIINSIGGYIDLNDMDGLKKYYETGLVPEIKKVHNLSLLNPETINNPPVFGLLISKYDYADNLNVTFNISSFFDYSTINMNIFDFVKILGILLDNAIEASSKTKEHIVELYITIDFYNRKQVFKISNSYCNKEIDIEQIFTKGYSTKEKKSGFGLWQVKQIIHKTSNLEIATSKNSNYFIQELKIQF